LSLVVETGGRNQWLDDDGMLDGGEFGDGLLAQFWPAGFELIDPGLRGLSGRIG
jgi:hypothetical protein